MKTEEVIQSYYNSFYSLIKVVKKRIDFEVIDQWQLKGILEGRHDAFIIAKSQLNTIKDLQEQISVWNEDTYKEDVNVLLASTDFILKEIKKAMDMDIVVDEIEEEKFKSVVHSKKVAGDFLRNISSMQDEIKYQLENKDTFGKSTIKNMATSRAKNR